MKTLAIMAGNPKVELLENGDISIDPQLLAFEAAMKIVQECRERVRKIAVVFDHKGLFRDQFFDETVPYPSNKARSRAKKHLRLSALHPKIQEAYADVAKDYGVHLHEISIYSEDVLRANITQQKLQNDRRFFVDRNIQSNCANGACLTSNEDEKEYSPTKVNCRGITASVIQKLSFEADEIRTYWVFDPVRVQPGTVTDGTELAYAILGVQKPTEQNLIVPYPYAVRPYAMTTNFTFLDGNVEIEMQPKKYL